MNNRYTHKLFDYTLKELNQGYVFTHRSCVCNERVALEQRHQVDDGSRCTTKADLFRHFRPMLTRLEPVDDEVVIQHATSKQRPLLLKAKETLLDKPIEFKDGYIRMFLKDDKEMQLGALATYLNQTGGEGDYSAPRCIQYRNKRYGLLLARYLIPIEKHVYSTTDWTGSHIFAKSRNSTQRAWDLRTKWDSFLDPEAHLLDHSKFDAHISELLLKLEHRYYNTLCPDPLLAYLLALQLSNRGFTRHGTTYRTKATRMSGDQNTGLGNSLINYAILAEVFTRLGVKFALYIDGDDSVVMTERGIEIAPEMFSEFGMKTKVAKTHIFEHVEFCQCRPVDCGSFWNMARNPLRLIGKLPWTTRRPGRKRLLDHLASVGKCELAMGMYLPVGQFIGHQLAKLSPKYVETDRHHAANKQRYGPTRAHLTEVLDITRASYELAWDLSRREQRILESTGVTTCVAKLEHCDETPFL